MRRAWNILGISLLVVVVLTAGCIDEEGDGGADKTPADKVILGGSNELVNSSNGFAFDMYGEMVKGDENVFFSPYSITTALGMAYEGAGGETAEEMEDVLDIPENDDERLEMMKRLQSLLNKEGASYELSTANAYWLAKFGELEQDYVHAIEGYYLAHGETVDFAGDPAGAADTINTWVEEETKDKIKDLLSVDDIDPLTYLILTNAVYFRSDWKYRFDEDATEEMDFHLSGGGNVRADFMHMCDKDIELNYTDNPDLKMLELPYKNREMNMYLLLPREGSLTDLESKLDRDYYQGLKEDLAPEYVDLHIPKFKLEEKYRLKENLINMGMPTAFEPGADFTNMTAEPVYIDKVIHQSFVEVNEEGTEAAAATAVIMKNYSAEPSDTPVEFRADHPFIFVIEHEESGQILFMGKVEDPNG